ncbi:hypothetical protein AYK26_05210 [Euryarchaeota archaeon SM23-78]|nr:MAG: hypothetical protein AYK26_05210 [Euryarchaeota archaeon SM23-78]MBW3001155.1 L,D-transpeptidase family protein [Candidatus Woesearchaeota archaeon]
MIDYFKDNLNLEQKLQNPTPSPTVEPQVQTSKKKHPVKTALLVGGTIIAVPLTIGGALVYSVYKLVWPPKFKKYLATAATIGVFYGITHPGKTLEFFGNVKKGIYNEFKDVLIKKKQADLAISQNNQMQKEVGEQEKVIAELEKKIEEETGIKVEFKNKYTRTNQELEGRKEIIDDLRSNNYQLKETVKGLEEKLDNNEENYEPIRQEITYSQPQQIESPIAEASSLEKKINTREIVEYPSNYNGVPISVSRLASDNNCKYIIYINKEENKLSLFEDNGNKLQWLKTYKCSTGINPASKKRKGDKATPEGVSAFTYRNFSSNLPDLYGAGVYGTGWDGIVICGADYTDRIRAISQGRNSTNGGVILSNKDLLDLDEKIRNNYRYVGVVIEHPTRPLSSR